ncbi:MAG: hypothetical protein Q9163_000687 [Psora crenata]
MDSTQQAITEIMLESCDQSAEDGLRKIRESNPYRAYYAGTMTGWVGRDKAPPASALPMPLPFKKRTSTPTTTVGTTTQLPAPSSSSSSPPASQQPEIPNSITEEGDNNTMPVTQIRDPTLPQNRPSVASSSSSLSPFLTSSTASELSSREEFEEGEKSSTARTSTCSPSSSPPGAPFTSPFPPPTPTMTTPLPYRHSPQTPSRCGWGYEATDAALQLAGETSPEQAKRELLRQRRQQREQIRKEVAERQKDHLHALIAWYMGQGERSESPPGPDGPRGVHLESEWIVWLQPIEREIDGWVEDDEDDLEEGGVDLSCWRDCRVPLQETKKSPPLGGLKSSMNVRYERMHPGMWRSGGEQTGKKRWSEGGKGTTGTGTQSGADAGFGAYDLAESATWLFGSTSEDEEKAGGPSSPSHAPATMASSSSSCSLSPPATPWSRGRALLAKDSWRRSQPVVDNGTAIEVPKGLQTSYANQRLRMQQRAAARSGAPVQQRHEQQQLRKANSFPQMKGELEATRDRGIRNLDNPTAHEQYLQRGRECAAMANQTVIDKLEIQAVGKHLTSMLYNRTEDDQPAVKVPLVMIGALGNGSYVCGNPETAKGIGGPTYIKADEANRIRASYRTKHQIGVEAATRTQIARETATAEEQLELAMLRESVKGQLRDEVIASVRASVTEEIKAEFIAKLMLTWEYDHCLFSPT